MAYDESPRDLQRRIDRLESEKRRLRDERDEAHRERDREHDRAERLEDELAQAEARNDELREERNEEEKHRRDLVDAVREVVDAALARPDPGTLDDQTLALAAERLAAPHDSIAATRLARAPEADRWTWLTMLRQAWRFDSQVDVAIARQAEAWELDEVRSRLLNSFEPGVWDRALEHATGKQLREAFEHTLDRRPERAADLVAAHPDRLSRHLDPSVIAHLLGQLEDRARREAVFEAMAAWRADPSEPDRDRSPVR